MGLYSQKIGKRKKLVNALLRFSVLLFCAALAMFAVAVSVVPCYAALDIDLSPLTDMLPTIIEIMVFSMVLGLIGGLMQSMSGGRRR